MNTIFKGSLSAAAIVVIGALSLPVSASTAIAASAGHPYNGTTGNTESYGMITNSGTGLLQMLLPLGSFGDHPDGDNYSATVAITTPGLSVSGVVECGMYDISEDGNTITRTNPYQQSVSGGGFQTISVTQDVVDNDSTFVICNMQPGTRLQSYVPIDGD